MTPRSSFVAWASFAAVLTGALALTLSLGGCPIAQQPATTPATDDQQTDDTGSTTTNTRPGGRPIPPPPVDTTDTTGGSGTSGGGSGGGAGSGGDTTFSQPISVVITVPDGFDINILPTGEAFISYEVFGGNPTDGAINVQLFYDQDGLPNTGDEVVLKSNLAPRGTERFTPNLAPGVYRIGIVASNSRDASRTYANGRLVLVGEAGITFNQPTQDLRIRPNTSVQVQLTITSLATALSYTVFTDTNTTLDGNERVAFSAGGLGGTGTILTDNFAPGTYFIGVTTTDSVGQTKTQYFSTPGGFRSFTIDLAPSVAVSAPNDTVTIDPSDPAQRIITVALSASDPEGAAQVQVFRDIDAVFNGNEVPIGAAVQLDSPAPRNLSFDIDASTLPAGTFKFGATANDGVGQPIVAYAAGTRRINAAPRITITNPLNNVSVPAGAQVVLQWSATDPENRIPNNGVNVLLAQDADADGQPDAAPNVLATFGSNVTSFPIDTTPLVGRYVAGIRVRDDVGATVTAFAPGAIIVNNDPPTVTINEPTDPVAVRPAAGTMIPMTFTVGDRERSLATPGGVQVVVARDDDEDGQPDGDPVLTLNGPFGLGFNFYSFDTTQLLAAGILNDLGYGWFLLGVQARDVAGNITRRWVPLTADRVAPEIELVEPTASITRDRIGVLQAIVRVTDTSNDFNTVRAILDNNAAPLQRETNPVDPSEFEMTLISTTPTGTENQNEYLFEINLDPAAGVALPADVYFLYVVVDDNIGMTRIERLGFYNPSGESNPLDFHTAWIRDRLMGNVNVACVGNPSDACGLSPAGTIMRGFNFNDLAGSDMERIADVTGDDLDEALIVSRFGKAYLVDLGNGLGFGEAYMMYGDANRLSGTRTLNAVGRGSIPGLIFPGVRAALNRTFIGTEGISDVTVVDDMDGDGIADLVFGFPRVESVALSVDDTRVQADNLRPDLPGMGSLEYNAWNAQMGVWTPNMAQFTRGGVVIASSHNTIMTNRLVTNRNNDRVLDLHEVGQLFGGMSRPAPVPYIRQIIPGMPANGCANCEPDMFDAMGNCTQGCGACGGNQMNPAETAFTNWVAQWDVVLNNQGPGGFHTPWTNPPANPPMFNPAPWPYQPCNLFGAPFPFPFYPDKPDPCTQTPAPRGCQYTNVWYNWPANRGDMLFPCTRSPEGMTITQGWCAQGNVAWSGFYGPETSIRQDAIGARVLGQAVENRFGTSVANDGVWLYVAAPNATAQRGDVPLLPTATRNASGIVYQLRTDSATTPGAPTKSQLWMEPYNRDPQGGGQPGPATWPFIDAELQNRVDYTMPVPHQYIIESVGSLRGNAAFPNDWEATNGGCPPDYRVQGVGQDADTCSNYTPYPVDTAGRNMDSSQIVGPHDNARVAFVRGLGDVNGDGVRDYAVGSLEARSDFANAGSPIVGAVFIIYSRPTGVEGDLLLERLSLAPDNPNRLNGVYLKGVSGAVIGRSFDTAGDFDNDGVDDVIVGNPAGANGAGEAIVVLGSPADALQSPAGGWTFDGAVASGQALRFVGADAGDLTGQNVAGLGDIDGDGFEDILISAPGAADPTNPTSRPGVVYLVYGSPDYRSDTPINLADVGTAAVPGVKWIGRVDQDFLGGDNGTTQFNVNPAGGATRVYSRGVAAVGDIDGDGLQDYAISAMLADPNNKTNAGEVYVIYGKGDQNRP